MLPLLVLYVLTSHVVNLSRCRSRDGYQFTLSQTTRFGKRSLFKCSDCSKIGLKHRHLACLVFIQYIHSMGRRTFCGKHVLHFEPRVSSLRNSFASHREAFTKSTSYIWASELYEYDFSADPKPLKPDRLTDGLNLYSAL